MKTARPVSGGVAAALFFTLCLGGFFGAGAPVARAATSPDLATAADYSILAGSQVTNVGATTISGDVGISPGIGAPPHYTGFGTVTLGGTIHDADGAALTAQGDKDAAYADLASQGCTTDYGGVTKELAGEVLAPGVYCATSFHLSSGTLTLNGSATDVWIFKSASDLVVTGASSQVLFTGGGLACNVWWRVVSTATFDAGSAFVGNVLAGTSATFAAGSSLDGRALAGTAEVTLDGSSISGPSCTAAGGGSGTGQYTGTITVVKTVVNDNGGTDTVSDFPLFIDGTQVVSGATNAFSFYSSRAYVVSETSNAQYVQSFSGECDEEGVVFLYPAVNAFCVVTNDDIGAPVIVPPVPPIISVVKVPSPLVLPDGPGDITYAFTVVNQGTVPMTDVTVVDDSCEPVYAFGDTDLDDALDVSETWAYRCTRELDETHTNTVVATGWANGLSASDVAVATVVVGVPLVPPLIHVTKVPSPLALLAGGGSVTYTETITNPGTVPLSGVALADDRCSPVVYRSGDTNGDALLDPGEAWVYTCQSTLTETTTNTAIATGSANGFTVRDLAIVTVVVATAVPALPNTGIAPASNEFAPVAVAAALLSAGLFLYVLRKQRT